RAGGSGPTARSRTRARSRAVRAIGRLVDSGGQSGGAAAPEGTRPREGLKPVRPVTADGMRIDPPPSEPVASGTRPPATAAAEPPDELPGDRSVSHGFRVAPNTGFSVSAFQPSSGVLVLPTTTQPAARRRATSGESSVAGWPDANAADPCEVTKPHASSRSFTAS